MESIPPESSIPVVMEPPEIGARYLGAPIAPIAAQAAR
jgi:hypothetical protein